MLLVSDLMQFDAHKVCCTVAEKPGIAENWALHDINHLQASPATNHLSNFCPLVAVSVVALYQQSIFLHLQTVAELQVVHEPALSVPTGKLK